MTIRPVRILRGEERYLVNGQQIRNRKIAKNIQQSDMDDLLKTRIPNKIGVLEKGTIKTATKSTLMHIASILECSWEDLAFSQEGLQPPELLEISITVDGITHSFQGQSISLEIRSS